MADFNMTREEAIRILDPETTGEAISEIEYYGGFSGKAAVVNAVSDACILALSALQEQKEQERGCEYCNEGSDGYRKNVWCIFHHKAIPRQCVEP